MAVHERTWRRYQGPLSGPAARFWVVPRYALMDVFRSRMFLSFYLLCFLPSFVGLIMIYLRHNLAALAVIGLPPEKIQQSLPIDGHFFAPVLQITGFCAFLVAVAVAPALISPDLRNNGLALYLSRPITRPSYVLGKLSVLALLMSAITWVPGLALFLLQAYLEGGGWFGTHLRLGAALLAGSAVWIVSLSLLALAVSAWVKWKPLARIVLIILLFVMQAFAHILELALGTWWGGMLSVWQVIETIWAGLFGLDLPTQLPVGAAWVALIAGTGVCMALLWRRLRAYEVVR